MAARKAERLRRQRRKERLLLVGVILLMVGSMVAYGFYLKYFYFGKPRPSHKPATPASEVLNE